MNVYQTVVDWFSFTIPVIGKTSGEVAADVAYFVGDSSRVVLPHGRYGYPSAFAVCGTGVVLWHPDKPELGVHCELPSKALAVARLGVIETIDWVVSLHGSVKRLDVAMDTDAVTVSELVEMESDGRLVSRSSNRRLVVDLKTDGKTLYVGSPNSRRMVRCYDKRIEADLDYDCTRIEVQFRAEYAQQAALYALGGVALKDLIFSTIDFRDVGEDSNVTRRERCEWWQAVVDGCEKLSFALLDAAKGLEDVYDWVSRQVAPALAFLCFAFGGQEWLTQMIAHGATRLNVRHLSILASLHT